MVEKILNNTTPYGKIRASHEGSLHSSTLISPFPHYKCSMYMYLEVTEFDSEIDYLHC